MRLNIVPAARGAQWVKSGWRTFIRQPLALGGLFFLFFGMMSVLSIIPMLGTFAGLALFPSATLGLLQATRLVEAGRFPMPVTLITAFTQGAPKRNQMLLLGAYYAVAFFLSLGFTMLIDGGAFANFYLTGQLADPALAQESGIQSAAILGTLLYAVLALVFWHAPALVFWFDVSPGKALFFSLTAVWRNKAAMLVYFLSWLAVLFACAVGVTVLSALLGEGFIQLIAMPLILMIAAVGAVSAYFSVRDTFDGELPALPDLPRERQS